jgi:predicted transcriptional regulator of viral defense system
LLTDSVVVIPKTIAKWMLQDIEKAKSYEEEIKVLYGSIDKKQDIIGKQDTIIDMLRIKNTSLSKTLIECEELVASQELAIAGLNTEVKKKKRHIGFWKVVAVTATLGILGNHLHWKYVKP